MENEPSFLEVMKAMFRPMPPPLRPTSASIPAARDASEVFPHIAKQQRDEAIRAAYGRTPLARYADGETGMTYRLHPFEEAMLRQRSRRASKAANTAVFRSKYGDNVLEDIY